MTAISYSNAASNAYYLAHGGYFLNSVQTSGNWLLDVGGSNGSNWLDPSGSGPDIASIGANAFARAHTATADITSNLIINQARTVLQQQLQALQSGHAVNILA